MLSSILKFTVAIVILQSPLLSLPPSEDVTHLDLAYQKAGRKPILTIENTQRQKLKEQQPILYDSLSLDLWS